MKRFILKRLNWILGLGVSLSLIFGCTRSINVAPTTPGIMNTATPSFTYTNTFAPTVTFTYSYTYTNTSTSTNTSTNTPTSVSTNTYTFTSTKTNTPSNTNTPVFTFTNTSTPTQTFTNTNTRTNTFTSTMTYTNTATPTATYCIAASYSAVYSMDSSLQCWQANPGSSSYITNYGITTNNPQSGTGSLQAVVNNTTGTNQAVNFNINFATPQNLAGMQMIAWVYVDPTVASGAWASGIQIFDQTVSGGVTNWTSAPWVAINNPGANVGVWFPVTIVFGSNGDNAAQVVQFGVQVAGVPNGASGNFYLDNIQIVAAPPTPTFTNTVLTATFTNTPSGPTNTPTVTYTFTDTNTVVPTNTFTNSPTNTDSPTPGATNTFTPTNTPTPCSPVFQPTYTFDSTTQCWTAWNGGSPALSPLTVQVDNTTFHSGTGSLEVIIPYVAGGGQAMIGMQFASAVSIQAGTTFSFFYKSSMAGGNAQVFDQSPGWDGGAWQSSLNTTWTGVTFVMNPATPSSVQQLGFQVPGANGAFTTPVTIWIDDVVFTPPVPTPTFTYTPLITNTFTPTCTTTTTPALIDDVEDNNNQVIVQQCRNGYWYASNDGTAGGVQLQSVLGPGVGAGCAGSSTYAMSVTANALFTGWGSNFGFNLTSPQAPYDASQWTGIQFCAISNTGTPTVSFQVPDANSVATAYASGPHAVNFNLTNSWALYQVTFTTLSTTTGCPAPGCNTYGSPTVFQPSQIETFQWQPPGATAYNIEVDNISFY